MEDISCILGRECLANRIDPPAKYKSDMLRLIFIALTHRNNSLQLGMPPHLGKLVWHWSNQASLYQTKYCVLGGKAVLTKFKVMITTPTGLNPQPSSLEWSTLPLDQPDKTTLKFTEQNSKSSNFTKQSHLITKIDL